jgi:hypothetical protein
MRSSVVLLTFLVGGLLALAVASDDKAFSVEGVVVAVQGTKGEARINVPHSMGDMVEVWMVRVEKWPRSEKRDFVLVEYKHRDAVVRDSELDSTVWRFVIRPTPPANHGTCMSWWTQSFMPTAQSAHRRFPLPKGLGCFLMQKRPVALRHTKVENER